jgi:uncharacterized delta-60 repeat protein
VSGGDGVAAVRLNTSGAPDPVLGANGTYTIGPGVLSTSATARAVAVQGDGKIVIAGSMATEGFVVRIDPNGPAVPPVPGKTDLSHVFPSSSMGAVGVQPARIVVGGTASSHVIVAAVTLTGGPDLSFGTTNGSAVFAPEAFENVHDGVLTPTAIFLSGAIQGGADVFPAIFRFSPDGEQPTYTWTNPPDAYNYRYYGIAAQSDGKVVGVGFGGTTASGTRSVVTRFNPDGSVDETFAPNEPVKGSKVFQIGGNTFMRAIAVAPDGGIIVGGSSPSGPTVARLWN